MMKAKSEIKGNWMMAATYAEAGEWETAKSITPELGDMTQVGFFSKIFAAVAFAEEGLHDEASRLAGVGARHAAGIFGELEDLGLSKAHMRFGTVCFE
ncbi:MAG: hypothetical protein V1706_10420 [Pseudomonadota bacterium]